MPVVPRSQRTVQNSGFSGARASDAGATLESFGGGASLERVRDAAQGVGDTVQTIIQEERKKAYQIDVTEADRKASELETRLTVDTRKNYLGKKAGEASTYVNDEWSRGISEIEEGISSPEAKMAFKKISSNRWEGLNKTVQMHSASEFEKYDQQETLGYISTSRNSAVLHAADTEKISEEIRRQTVVFAAFAERHGIPQDSEQFKAGLTKELSSTHRGVIDARLDGGYYRQATEYYKAAKESGQITAQDAEHLDRAIEAGTILGEGQRLTDEIMGKKPTMTGAYAEARKIEDPKIRQEVEREIGNRFAIEERAKDFEQKTAHRAGAGIHQKGPARPPFHLEPDVARVAEGAQQRA